MFKEVFYTKSVKNYINKIVDRKYSTDDITKLQDINKTLVITTKEDYNDVYSLFPASNIRILNKETLLELCYTKNSKIIPNHLYQNKLSLKFNYYESILENPNESMDAKYFYTVAEAINKLHVELKITKSHSTFVHKDRLYIALNGLNKGSLSKKDFERKYQDFINSEFVFGYSKYGFTLKMKQNLIFKDTNHNIYTQSHILRGESFNIQKFTKYVVEFCYAKPLEVLKNTHEVKTLSLTNVANKLGMTASNVQKHTKDMKKMYKFEVVTEKEYQYYMSNKETMKDTFMFPVYTNQNKLNNLTGEVKRKTYYFKLKGTKLLSNLKYKSFVFTDGKMTKLSATVKTRASLLSIASKENHIDIVKNNDFVEFFNEITRLEESETSTEDSIESRDIDEITSTENADTKKEITLNVQFVGRNLKVIKEKLLLFTTIVELNGNVQDAKRLYNRKLKEGSISSFIQQIAFKTFSDFKHIGEQEENSFKVLNSKENYKSVISIVYSIYKKIVEFKLKNTRDNLKKLNKSLLNIISKIEKYTKDTSSSYNDKYTILKEELDKLSNIILLSLNISNNKITI